MASEFKVRCGWCNFEVDYPQYDTPARKAAWTIAMEHDQACELNPLVQKVRELERRLQGEGIAAPEGLTTDSGPAPEVELLLETLSQIRQECAHRIATLKEPVRMVGFKNIERMISKVLPGKAKRASVGRSD